MAEELNIVSLYLASTHRPRLFIFRTRFKILMQVMHWTCPEHPFNSDHEGEAVSHPISLPLAFPGLA